MLIWHYNCTGSGFLGFEGYEMVVLGKSHNPGVIFGG
jgi:hypothetical protein